MKDFRKALILFIMVSVSLIFAVQLGPWSHFKAITSDYTINLGDTLTISAGTEVRFLPNTKMNIYGVVISNGTSSDPVIFGALDPLNPTWGGIIISNADPLQVSTFTSTVFTKMFSTGDGPINIGESSVNFNNCRFFDNHADFNGGAVYARAGLVNFTACVFRNNDAENGGGLFIYNNASAAPSTINVDYCSFLANSASNGGGLYIEDYDVAMYTMALSIQNSGFHYNKAKNPGGLGGGIYMNIFDKIDLKLKYCKLQYNDAMYSGGGIYAKYCEIFTIPVLHQEFANLLITENSAMDGAGVYFDTGFIENPGNIDFINTTIAYNYILPGKTSKEFGGGGIHIVSNDNYPMIKNSIIWANGNEWFLDQFLITDDSFPNPGAIFSYCAINDYVEGQGNIDEFPQFVRQPKPFTDTLTLSPLDRFDYHLRLGSPCIDAGDPNTIPDPNATPEIMYPPVNMGAYGNTNQASIRSIYATTINAWAVNDLTIPAGGVYILDFQGKAGAFDYSDIILGEGSQLHLNASNAATINIGELSTPMQPEGKFFNDSRIIIQPVDSTDTAQPLNITDTAILHGVELSNMQLNVSGVSPTVNINNSKIYNSDVELQSSGISITNGLDVMITNTSVDNFETGILVDLNGTKEAKASRRIANNTVTFDADASKAGGQKVGVQVQNANGMNIENNDIENGDIGVQMSSSSGGRITNNTVTFDADASKGGKLSDKIAINVISGTDTEIDNNDIWINDISSTEVSAINVDNSSAQISYNKINFDNASGLTRNGIVFNNVSQGTYVYHNTMYNATYGVNNIPGFYGIDFINNILWCDASLSSGVSNPDSITFKNNDINDLTGITGTGNFSTDPCLIDPSTNDLVIATSSPCVNTGYIIPNFHIADSTYFGVAPEIGYMEYYEIELSAPEDPTISVTDSTFTFSWGSVQDASTYTVYASDDPYAVFDSVATVATTSWETSLATSKRFFYVIANDASKNVVISDKPQPYYEGVKQDNNRIVKKRIPKKIKSASSSR